MREERIFQRPSKAFQFPRNDDDEPQVKIEPRPWVPLKSWPVAEHPRQTDIWAFRSIGSYHKDTEL
jgi:hypothetical protein